MRVVRNPKRFMLYSQGNKIEVRPLTSPENLYDYLAEESEGSGWLR